MYYQINELSVKKYSVQKVIVRDYLQVNIVRVPAV